MGEADRSKDPSTSAEKTIKNYDNLAVENTTWNQEEGCKLHTIACSIEVRTIDAILASVAFSVAFILVWLIVFKIYWIKTPHKQSIPPELSRKFENFQKIYA